MQQVQALPQHAVRGLALAGGDAIDGGVASAAPANISDGAALRSPAVCKATGTG
jgi:hypothetical protein